MVSEMLLSRLVVEFLGFGITCGAVRMTAKTESACSTACGTTWIALAPAPITATRFPVMSMSGSHSAVWIIWPR